MEWSNDIANDPKFYTHDAARPDRRYDSLASAPIRRGDEIVGVLNVVWTIPGALTTIADLYYVTSLAWVIGLAMPPPAEEGRALDAG